MKTLLLFSLLTICFLPFLQAQNHYADISAGIFSYHLPASDYKFSGTKPIVNLGLHRFTGPKEKLSIGVQIAIARNKTQGDAYQVHGSIHYSPVKSEYISLSIGTGLGYQISKYPSSSLIWNKNEWQQGKKYKGVIPIPIDLSLSFKRLSIDNNFIQPFISYRLQGHLRYSSNLNPLPKSNFLVGIKLINSKNN